MFNEPEAEAEETFRSALIDSSTSEEDFEGFSDSDAEHGIEVSIETVHLECEPSRSERGTKDIPPQRFDQMTSVTKHFGSEHRSFEEAIQRPQKAIWQAAMEEEITALAENQI